jgi:hypothetical protein
MKYYLLIFPFLFAAVNIYAQELKFEYSQSFSDVNNEELKTIINSWFARNNIELQGDEGDFFFIGEFNHKLSDRSDVYADTGIPKIKNASSEFTIKTQVLNQSVLISFMNPYLKSDSLIIDSTEIELQLHEFSEKLFKYLALNKTKDAAQDYNIRLLTANLNHTKKYLVKSGNKGITSAAVGLIGMLAGSVITVLPQIIDVNNPKVLTGAGIGITSVSGIVSFSIGISGLKDKKRAGEQIEF